MDVVYTNVPLILLIILGILTLVVSGAIGAGFRSGFSLVASLLIGSMLTFFVTSVSASSGESSGREAFEDYYNVQKMEGVLPVRSIYGVANDDPTQLLLYFNEDGALLHCTILVEDNKYSGYCEDGRTL